MKPGRPVRKILADLDVLRFPTATPESTGVICLRCSCPLSLLQPDLDLPDRLLGVCRQCKHWFLVELLADRSEAIILALPENQVIQELSLTAPEKGPVARGTTLRKKRPTR